MGDRHLKFYEIRDNLRVGWQAADERMIRGSVVVQRRRCGKANCRCADGEALHEATVLSYSEAGRGRTVMLAPGAGGGGAGGCGALPGRAGPVAGGR